MLFVKDSPGTVMTMKDAMKGYQYADLPMPIVGTYAKIREAFGRLIGNFQYTAFRLAEMATEVQMGRTFLDDLIAKHIRGESIVQEVSMAKFWLGEMVNRIAYQAVQIHDGYGYMEEYHICRIYCDVRALSIFAGTSEIMKLIISKNLGLSPL